MLLQRLTEALASRRPADTVVVLGVGSELRSDDAAGLHVARRVAALRLPGVHALEAGPSPENAAAALRALNPRFVLMVDAAAMREAPGSLRLIDPANVGGASFGTHGLPLTVLAQYLARETGCVVSILGIQPQSVEFGEELSPPVRAAVNEVTLALAACLGGPAATASD